MWLTVDLLLHGKLYNFTNDVSLNISLGVRDTLGVFLDDERINNDVFGYLVRFPSEWYLRGGVSMFHRTDFLIRKGETSFGSFDSVRSLFELGNMSVCLGILVWLSEANLRLFLVRQLVDVKLVPELVLSAFYRFQRLFSVMLSYIQHKQIKMKSCTGFFPSKL